MRRVRESHHERPKKRYMECCVCGSYAGHWEQHWNRDTGYGVCMKCIGWLKGRGETDAELLELYGVEGVNYGVEATP